MGIPLPYDTSKCILLPNSYALDRQQGEFQGIFFFEHEWTSYSREQAMRN